jgi:hypothetical protein
MTAKEALAISNSLEAKKNIAEQKRRAEELKVVEEENRKKDVEKETKKALRFLEPMIKEAALHGQKHIFIHWTNYEEDNNMYNKASKIGQSKDIRLALFDVGYCTCWFEYPYHDTWSLTVAWGYEESIKALTDGAEKTFNKEERQTMINAVNKRFYKNNQYEEKGNYSHVVTIALIVCAIIAFSLIVKICTT